MVPYVGDNVARGNKVSCKDAEKNDMQTEYSVALTSYMQRITFNLRRKTRDAGTWRDSQIARKAVPYTKSGTFIVINVCIKVRLRL